VSLTPEQQAALDAAAKAELWRRGDLSWKRFPHQQAVMDQIAALDAREFFSRWTRRGTKSGNGVLTCAEACLRPGGRALFLAPTAKSASEIAGDIAGKLLRDAPEDVRPEYHKQDKEFVFPSGGIWRLKGVNGETFENLRGGEYDVVVLDECAQYDQLEEIIFGVVMPMTLTTRGRILYQTTPPTSPGHYSVALYQKLHAQGLTSTITLRDVTHIPYEEKCRMLIAVGEDPARVADILAGRAEPETAYARREFFCEFIVDPELAVVPEFAKHKASVVVDEYPRPAFFDAYGAADTGMRDRTGILSGYLDFFNQTFVVEGEGLLNRANTAEIATHWGLLEAQLGYGGDRSRGGRVYLRVVDDSQLRVTHDLTTVYGLTTQPAQKHGREAAIASMRVAITSGRLKILSRCTQLIHQLETAIYKKSASGKQYDFERDQDGHFDLVDALIYLLRSVIWTRNPYPVGYDPRLLQATGGGFRRPTPQARSALSQAAFAGTPAGRRLLKRGGQQ
jgi:hypothetical protein